MKLDLLPNTWSAGDEEVIELNLNCFYSYKKNNIFFIAFLTMWTKRIGAFDSINNDGALFIAVF